MKTSLRPILCAGISPARARSTIHRLVCPMRPAATAGSKTSGAGELVWVADKALAFPAYGGRKAEVTNQETAACQHSHLGTQDISKFPCRIITVSDWALLSALVTVMAVWQQRAPRTVRLATTRRN